ncbi:hypothetical protein V8C35DRAFT_308482 [Trichoderma chlorosporum]
MADNLELINSLTAEQARAILVYLSNDFSVARKVNKLATDMKTYAGLTAICVQCDLAFDPSSTTKDCSYHNGELEVDYDGDFWADHDEDCHGTIDTDEMREEFPEGFQWTCCNLSGDADGCQLGRHQADPNKSEKGLDIELELDDEEESDGDEDGEDFDDNTHKGNTDKGDESEDLRRNKRQKREI